MSLPVILRPEALDDLATARDWYEGRQAGLGSHLLDAFDHALARIVIAPEGYECVVGRARRIKLLRFPYVVYFRELSDRLEVLAVLHGRQHEQTWHERL